MFHIQKSIRCFSHSISKVSQPRRSFFSWFRNKKHDPSLVEPENKSIQGLSIIPKYFTNSEHNKIVEEVSELLQREKPNYHYLFQRRTLLLQKEKLEQIPRSMKLIERIYKDGLIQEMADCVQITEYGQRGGSSIHGDRHVLSETVGIIGLVSKVVVTFRPRPPEPQWRLVLHPELEELEKLKPPPKEEVRVLLEPCALLMIGGDAKRVWDHGILPHEFHIWNNQPFKKEPRLSVTFWKQIVTTNAPSERSFEKELRSRIVLYSSEDLRKKRQSGEFFSPTVSPQRSKDPDK